MRNESESFSFFQLFRFANRYDWFLILIGTLATAVKSTIHPIIVIIYTDIVSMIIERLHGSEKTPPTYIIPLFGGGKVVTNGTHEENMAALYDDSIAYGIAMSIASIGMFIFGFISVDAFNLAALQQTTKIRMKFFESTIRQNIGWHDTTTDQNFALKMADNIEKIRDGISEKIAHFTYLIGVGVCCIAIGFVFGWKLTLVLSFYIPIIIACNYLVVIYQGKMTELEQSALGLAGRLVEEILGSIRTVISFGAEATECDRYNKLMEPACKAVRIKGAISGLDDGILRGFLFINCGAAFWYGTRLVLEDRENENPTYTTNILMMCFFGITIAADHISRSTPFLETFAIARACAVSIFQIIDTPSKIDALSTDGRILKNGLKGDIEFRDVFFRYPSRLDVTVLRGLNLSVRSGETVALVGSSGCGKSTCIQLLQRFYDPHFGEVMLDGIPIPNYNISWLRSNIAVVGQEPVLFQGTIGNNIRYGKPDASQKEIEEAARYAGVHTFISELPDAYDTFLSEKGTQLSGGQKQRIAIARALIQNPKILLLDEATSALDYKSEKLVQEALDLVSKGRTTVVVSHRLSAIKNSDRILFIEQGIVIEEGTHNELVRKGGNYYKMVTSMEIEDSSRKNEKLDDFSRERNFKRALSFNSEKNYTKRLSICSSTGAAEIIEEPSKRADFYKTFMRILKIAKPKWNKLLLASFCAAIYGLSQPAFAILFSEYYSTLAMTDNNYIYRKTLILSIICTVLGVVAFAAAFTQTYLFNSAGVWLTTQLRSITFKSILNQEVAWFDEDRNSVGSLSARLSSDSGSVQGAIGYPLSGIIQAFANLCASLVIGFAFCWQISLICLCTSPFMMGSIIFEAKYMAKNLVKEKEILEEASRIATEALSNIRTVAGLRREKDIVELYEKEMIKVEMQIKKRLRFRGVVNSFGPAVMFLGYAMAMSYAGILISGGTVELRNVTKVADSLLYGLMVIGMALSYAPSFSSALTSGRRLFEIVDREPKQKSPSKISTNFIDINTNIREGVTFDNVHFTYPTRSDAKILKGLDLSIKPGKTIALVGSSGCGKSTTIQLLQRYYDPDKGQICLNQRDIRRQMSLRDLRSHIGIVSQEPSLFERTIAENIAYGDVRRRVSKSEVIECAKMANAHGFISALPNGYETKLGSKGTQMSGGQKQRIAIARALVRNPKILLLDEATSALDLQSEKIVQQALDTACSGRTCIVIAHRLSTIQSADMICVVDGGKIVEKGTHSELLASGGIYEKLFRTQPNVH